MSCWDWIANLYSVYAPSLDTMDKLASILTSVGMFWLALGAHRIAKEERESRQYKIDKENRELFRAVYKEILRSLQSIYLKKYVEYDAYIVFYDALKIAELEMPESVSSYMRTLHDDIYKAYELYSFKMHPKGKEQPKNFEELKAEHIQLINKILDNKPLQYFQPYMRGEYK